MTAALSQPNSHPDDPHSVYTVRRAAALECRFRLERREALFGNARVGIFVAAVVLLYFVLGARVISPYWLPVPIAIFVLLSIAYERVRQELARCRRAIAYYDRGLERLTDRWPGTGEPGLQYLTEDHPYALDLDLFGRGSLFERLCTAVTRGGADLLAAWLLAPAAPTEILARQAAVAELCGKPDLRESLALLGADVPVGVDLKGLSQWGGASPILPRTPLHALAPVLVAVNLGLLAGWWLGEWHLYPFAIGALVQSCYAARFQRRVQQVVLPIERRAHELALLAGLLARIESEPFTCPRLRGLQSQLDAHGEAPSRRIARLVRLVYWLDCRHNPYFGMAAPLLLWSTQLAFAFETWRAHSGPYIGPWLEAAAEFEALCSLGTYAFETVGDTFPELAAEGPCYEGEGLGHPLLPRGRSVQNDIHLGKDLQVLIVSGSNMSGKSTLLRTVGINAVLALAGAPVRASRLRLSALAVGATLRVQDSLQDGRSRFFSEIRRISQLVDLARGPLPLLFLLDEILHGTNSHDRRLGAAAIVRSLVRLGAMGLVTTHDLALTHIADELGSHAANVHFEDRFDNGTIHFDYRMRPGVVQNSNALALMRAVGLEV